MRLTRFVKKGDKHREMGASLMYLSFNRFCKARDRKRPAAAMVEFAIVSPILFMLVLGCIEFGRAMMVSELAISAARTGCRVGVLPSKSTSDVSTAVSDFLDDAGIKNAQTTVTVNDKKADASSALRGDKVQVQVSVPFADNSWLPKLSFLTKSRVSGAIVMRRE
jgi:Flp pilus assembly protein TadG